MPQPDGRRANTERMNNMLEVKNISFEVAQNDGTAEIIKDLSFTIPDGRLTVITGPNGGGKSTLAKLIMGLEKVTAGEILWNGEDISKLSVTERARMGIGYAFQQPPRFKGMKGSRLLELAYGEPLSEGGLLRIPLPGRALRPGVCLPGDRLHPLRRGAEAD